MKYYGLLLVLYISTSISCEGQFISQIGYRSDSSIEIPIFFKHKSFKDYAPRSSSFKFDPIVPSNKKTIVFDSCKFQGYTYLYFDKFPDFSIQACNLDYLESMSSTIKFINLINSKLQGIAIREDSINLLVVQKDTFANKTIDFETSCLNQILISDCYFKAPLLFQNCRFIDGVFIYRDHFDSKIAFNNCIFSYPVTLRDIVLPDTFDFENNDLNGYRGEVDLTGLIPDGDRKCELNLYGTNIDKLRLDMTNFELYFPKYANIHDSMYVYDQLLNEMKRNGFESSEGYKGIDITNRELTATTFSAKCSNFFQKYWWNYGYSKSRIIIWAISFLFLFYSINLIIFNKLIWTYPIDNFMKFYLDEKMKLKPKKMQIAVNCFMLTCVIFWGLRIKIDKFKLENYGICAYIMLQYMVGIVCVAYIANIIIAR